LTAGERNTPVDDIEDAKSLNFQKLQLGSAGSTYLAETEHFENRALMEWAGNCAATSSNAGRDFESAPPVVLRLNDPCQGPIIGMAGVVSHQI
jgi:hypothetical protein